MNWLLSIAVVIVWLGIVPAANEIQDFYLAEQDKAQAMADAQKARQIEKRTQDSCRLHAGESIPIFDAAANFMGCRPRRTK